MNNFMCGIAGYILNKNIKNKKNLDIHLLRMTDALKHRGPDACGYWKCNKSKIYLGHRRLSIIDLSSKGDQPMHSNNKRYVIAFNGEIYNFRELKSELLTKSNIKFNNKTDTQVLLECISTFGFEKTLKKIQGMFAFALWDKELKVLYLVRDRIGKKPLYWGKTDDGIIFGSEIKSLLHYPKLKKDLNFRSLSAFLKFSYINSPHTIFRNISKVEPGSYIKFRNNIMEEKKYWSLKDFIIEKKVHSSSLELEIAIENLIENATVRRLESDVPLGVMLSGGIDSSLITAMAQKNSNHNLKTFSIRFAEKEFDESNYAREISGLLGTDHHEININDFCLKNIIQKLPDVFDEPFADSSQIPTILISQELKKHVTVALSGDGGDEVFCGYSRYYWATNFSNLSKYISPWIRKVISGSIKLIPSNKISYLNRFLDKGIFPPQFGDRIQKVAKILECESDNQIYSKLVSQTDPNKIFKKSFDHENEIDLKKFPGRYNIQDAMQYIDMKTYLPGDILVKVDRASMACGLEIRSPFLDHQVIEYSLKNLTNKEKIQKGKGKFILRKILSKYLPDRLINRPKMGFGVPLASWLRNDLKEWMLDTLNEKRINEQGLFNFKKINNLMTAHLDQSHNYHYELWQILMFQSWYDKWMK